MNNHITQLKGLVGKKSGTLQEIPPKKLEDLVVKGGKPFYKDYKETAAKDSGNLNPMLEILHGIVENENTVKNLSKKEATSATTPTDYQSLKEKLLQQVGSKAFLEAPGSSKQVREMKYRKFLECFLDMLPFMRSLDTLLVYAPHFLLCSLLHIFIYG